jgi:hypothetical protein
VWANPAVAGTYILSGQLTSPSGANTFSDSKQFSSDGTGAVPVNLLFDLNQVRASGETGYYRLSGIKLFGATNDRTEWLDTYAGTSGFQIGPHIASTPQSQPSEEGTSASLSVTADSGSLSYQWLFNGTPIPGATNATLNVGTINAATAGAYAVTVTNETGTMTTPAATLTATPATTFARWRQARFTAGQLADPAVSGPNANPAKSGMANLLKYAFGSDPFAVDRSVLPFSGSELKPEDGKQHLTFSFRQRTMSTDLAYTVEVSDDLVSWDSSGNQLEQVGAPTPTGDGVTQTVKVRLKTPIQSLGKKFIRLRVTGN